MSTPEGVVAGLLGSAASEAAAFAAGIALGPTLAPLVRFLENEAWANVQTKPLDAATAAEVAAELYDTYDDMQTEASYSGYDAARFAHLWDITLTGPGMGELLTMLRRGTIAPADFTHGLRKAKFETRWDTALTDLQHVRLSPQEIALGIVRSVVADPGLLAATLDLSGGVVPAYPEWPGDALAEALAGGIDKDRLRVMVGEIGLPMSAQQAASAYFRDIIKLGDYNRAILEGDTRPEWAPYILEQARQIPSNTDFVQGRLRGWIDDAAMYAGSARHGMTEADTALLFKIHGRPLSWHQVFIGLRRGGVYDGPTTDLDPAFLTALKQSDIRPEWYNLAWAQRYNYPTAFVLRTLTEAGDLTQAETEQILLYEGWEPTLAQQVSTRWAGGTAATTSPDVKKAQTQLWTTTHKSYVAREATAADVNDRLTLLGVDSASQSEILALWDSERALIRKGLSAKEIVKALGSGIINPDTGAAWTTADATARLLALGYDQADAASLIEGA